ncbi:MAG: glycosyltransferase family 9 protein [Phycisphaerales bacterium]|nr:glycosyltransferase family 9 protein [Phycisphaerales bacterium]
MATQTPNPVLARARRILIIRPSALGDVCRSVPVLASLRAAMPAAHIDWLVQDTFADAISAHPMLDGIIPLPRARLRRWASPQGVFDSLRWLRTLRRGHYDLAIDAQGLMRSAIFAIATGSPARIGYANAQEFAGLTYTHAPRIAIDRHSVDRMCALLVPLNIAPVFDARLYSPPGAWGRVSAALALNTAEPYCVIAPTSRWPGKRWPIDRFASLARSLLDSGRITRVVVVGSPSERPQCAALFESTAGDARVIDGVGRTSVAELMALIEHSALVIANDSAAIHMAVGFDRPMVALYGPTNIRRVGPWQRDASVIQHIQPGDTLNHKDEASGRELMARITTLEVIERALSVLPQH